MSPVAQNLVIMKIGSFNVISYADIPSFITFQETELKSISAGIVYNRFGRMRWAIFGIQILLHGFGHSWYSAYIIMVYGQTAAMGVWPPRRYKTPSVGLIKLSRFFRHYFRDNTNFIHFPKYSQSYRRCCHDFAIGFYWRLFCFRCTCCRVVQLIWQHCECESWKVRSCGRKSLFVGRWLK